MESGAPQRAGTRGSTSVLSTSTPGIWTSATESSRPEAPARTTFSPDVRPAGSGIETGWPGSATAGLARSRRPSRPGSVAAASSSRSRRASDHRDAGHGPGLSNSIPIQGRRPCAGPDCHAVSSSPSKAANGSVSGSTGPWVSAKARDDDAATLRAPRIWACVSQRLLTQGVVPRRCTPPARRPRPRAWPTLPSWMRAKFVSRRRRPSVRTRPSASTSSGASTAEHRGLVAEQAGLGEVEQVLRAHRRRADSPTRRRRGARRSPRRSPRPGSGCVQPSSMTMLRRLPPIRAGLPTSRAEVGDSSESRVSRRAPGGRAPVRAGRLTGDRCGRRGARCRRDAGSRPDRPRVARRPAGPRWRRASGCCLRVRGERRCARPRARTPAAAAARRRGRPRCRSRSWTPARARRWCRARSGPASPPYATSSAGTDSKSLAAPSRPVSAGLAAPTTEMTHSSSTPA